MKKAIISLALAALMLTALATIGFGAQAADAVVPTRQGLTVNGRAVQTQAYNINGNNYFKLRDVAAMMGGTESRFDVGYDEASHTVTVTKGTSYKTDTSENTAGEDLSATCVKSSQTVTIDGRRADMTAYNIGGSNYFKLRDLGMMLGFYVDYDAAAASVRVTSPDAYGDEGWRDAYSAAVIEARQSNRGGSILEYDENDAVSYQLYDIDKDGVPELFIHYGIAEAARSVKVYTYKNGEIAKAGETFCGHTSLYSCPGENGFVLYWGHMGAASMSKVSLEGGALKDNGVIFEEMTEGDYKPVSSVVPGAAILDNWRTDITAPIEHYRDVLQNAQGYECPKWSDDAKVREAIMDVIKNDGSLFFLCADAYGDEGGYMNLSTALAAGGPADEYAKEPLKVSQYAWVDANNDGQTDCVVRFAHTDGGSDVYAVFTSQSGEIYAYTVSYFDGKVLRNGVFAEDYDGDGVPEFASRVMFDGVQGYTCYVAESGSTPEAEWIKY
ncbi:MAG: hypothetical protein IIZ19_00310 [Clostridia bacterium]|nr:hypothetical protein [Clostridia bacterium]